MGEKKFKVITRWRNSDKGVEETFTLAKLFEYVLDELESKQPDFEDDGYTSGSHTVEEIESDE